MIDYSYHLQFIRESNGLHVEGGMVSEAWLEMLREQAVFRALRLGIVDAAAKDGTIFLTPEFLSGDSPQVKSLRSSIVVGGDTHELLEHEATDAFAASANDALANLAKAGEVNTDEKATYRVFARKKEAEQPSRELPIVKVSVSRQPLPLQAGRLEDYLAKATPSGEISERDHPIFVPREHFEKATEYCFKTGDQEGGSMLLGQLYQQREPHPEIFSVVHAAVELRHAEQSRFGFEPTAKTFSDLQNKMKLRRERLGFDQELPSVLVHNHPFEPSIRDDGEANCKTCPIQQTCELTSSFYSASDDRFHSGVYGRQPWVAGIVIGLTPRQERDVRMFCLDGSRSRERGFYWI